ncbi:Ankyrin Repeat Domain-Containing Protein 7 [Manis pentadactyla]|nr:Ankyrin Repeat Domain-Containing Protein 7 [Manis pentadactyla]
MSPLALLGDNFQDKDLKKLLKASSVGDLEKVKMYLQLNKHDVNMLDREHRSPLTKDGYTPLLLAITENNAEMVEFLLKKGANMCNFISTNFLLLS